MRVIEYAEGVARLGERPMPTAATGEVALRVKRVGVCGTDLGAVQRGNPRFRDGIVIGHELVGTRMSDGARFTTMPLIVCGACVNCRTGAENLCGERTIIGAHMDGFLSETVVLPSGHLTPLPDDVTDAQAALIEPMATALHAWRRTAAHRDSRVGIIGAGAIGLCLAWVARMQRVECVVAEIDEAKHAAAVAAADQVVSQLAEEFDVVFDTVGLASTRIDAIAATRPGCPTVFVGLHSADMPLDGNDLISRERNLLGSFAYTRVDFMDAVGYVRGIGTEWVTEVSFEDAVDVINGDARVRGATKYHVVLN